MAQNISMLHLGFVLLTVSAVLGLQGEHYWRDYDGTIPVDAILGGKDKSGNNVYIGQAYIKEHGLFVVQITPGQMEVAAVVWGVRKVNKHVKILCGPSQKYYWMPGNSGKLHVLLEGKFAVVGGHEDWFGDMHIGRIIYEGGTKIGKVNSFFPGSATFHFDRDGIEWKTNDYEILMYRNVSLDIRSKVDE